MKRTNEQNNGTKMMKGEISMKRTNEQNNGTKMMIGEKIRMAGITGVCGSLRRRVKTNTEYAMLYWLLEEALDMLEMAETTESEENRRRYTYHAKKFLQEYFRRIGD